MKLLKKLSAIILAIVLLFGSMPMADLELENLFSSIAFAAEEDNEEEEEKIDTRNDFVSGDFIYRYTSQKEIRIMKYMGSDKNVVVPETIDGNPVIKIELAAFCPDYSYDNAPSYNQYNNPECANIESITLPETIKEINKYAFYRCRNLKSINLPENLRHIGYGAFSLCSSLESLEMPNQLVAIGNQAFYGTKIKSLTISVGEKTFSAAKDMLDGSVVENISIEATSITISSGALENENLKNVELKATEKLTIQAFSIVSNALENLTVEGKIINIADNGIQSDSLKELTLDATISIGESGIVSSSLESLTLSGAVDTVVADAILCPSLKVVTINGDVTGCATSAFGFRGDDTLPDTVVVNNCFSADVYDMFEEFLDYVGEVTFTETVKQIVFKKYVEPAEIFTEDVYQYYINENGEAVIYKYTGKHKGTVHLFVPETLGGAPVTVIGRRAFEDLESDFEFIYLPDTVTRIENNAFAGSKKISTIRISPNLESIGHRAFCGAEGLWAVGPYNSFDDTEGGELILPDAITYIPTEAFGECRYLTQIQANGVIAVLDGAFRKIGMNNTDFSEDFYWVGDGAFYNSRIKQFNQDKNVTHLGKEAFYDSYLTQFELNETLTEIPEGAFYSTNITEIVIPSGVETIGKSAFGDCTLLKNVEISDSVTTIGEFAFSGCTALESIKIPDSVTTIGESAFYNCKSLKTLSLPKALTVIEKSTFENCESLESIKIPNSVTTIGESAFYNCKSLKTLSLPKAMTVIEASTFENCESLESVEIPYSVTSIEEKAFYNCKALLGIEIPDSVTIIKPQTFENCSALKTLKLPNSLKTILQRAFCGCSALEKLEIPESVTSIGNNAFWRCSSLTGELTIPKNITEIGTKVFDGTGYTVLNYNAADCYCQTTSFYGMKYLETIKVGSDVTHITQSAFHACTTAKNIVIADSITTISNYAFYGCYNVESITLPKSLLHIESYAFYDCSKVAELTIPKGVITIGYHSLPENLATLYYNAENCQFGSSGLLADTKITNVIIGNNVRRIPDNMFRKTNKIETVVISDSVTEIGSYAFYQSGIKSVKLPSSPIVIEAFAFADSNIKIEGNTLPNGLRIIGENAFQKNNGIEEIYIPDSVVDIADSAFDNCSNLKKVRMSSSVKLIASNAFYNCTNLEEFTWDADVKLIADYAFYNCKALKNFNFAGVELVYPNSFTNSGVTLVTLGHDKNDEATDLIMIETQSFMGCENLDTVAIGGNVTTIKSEAFASCSSLETAVISDSVINIATNAFDNCDSLTIYCEEDSYAHKYAVKNNIPVSTFVVAPIPNQTYTGSAIEPEIDVSVSGEKVMENTDFTVKYSNNINVGTAKVTVSGKGIYKVLASVANFTIITKSIAPVTFATISEQDYTGEAVIPTLTVTDGNRVLKEGVDYTVTFKNNVNEGTATATIQGIGNYHGTASTSFEIRELSTSQSASNKILDFLTSLWLKIVSFFTSIFR